MMNLLQLPLFFLIFATCSKQAAAVKNETMATPLSTLGTGMTNNEINQVDLETSRKGQSGTIISRKQRECTMTDLNRLKVKISIALERQIEKMLMDDYVDTHPESPSCVRYQGITMNYAIRLFIRTTVENIISDYKLELLRP